MKSRRSPRTIYQQPMLQDPPPPPPPPVPSTPSSHRPRSPSSSSAASTSSVASVIQSTPTSKMPLRTPTSHPSPGYQGYFDPYTQQQQQQQPSPQVMAQIVAAQAAMLASNRQRSTTIPSPKSPPNQASSAAGAAANAVMPRSALEKQWESANSSTATLTGREQHAGGGSGGSNGPTPTSSTAPPIPPFSATINTSPTATKKESSSKMNKLFSGRIGTTSLEKGQKPPPSPSKISHSIISNPIPRLNSHITGSDRKGSFSGSTSTLVGAATATATDIFGYQPPQAPYASSSLYSSSPPTSASGKEHHSLSRSHFLRVRKDLAAVALSSASSNSKAISLDGSSIYTFIPSSPSSSVFTQSHSKSSNTADTKYGSLGKSSGDHDFNATGVDDWAFVRRNVLALFDGELLRTPVEDMNKYVTNHIRRCYERKKPEMIISDVNDILDAGMLSLDPALVSYPDDKLVPRLVEIWQFVFAQILPYFEAVFLPLQQEFKGVGTVLSSPREARDFWLDVVEKEAGGIVGLTGGPGAGGGGSGGGINSTSVASNASTMTATNTSSGNNPDPMLILPTHHTQLLDNHHRILDTRRMALISFRDNVILPLHSKLRIIFSRPQIDFSSDLPNATESVARVLQCISVLASILSKDEKQSQIDELAKTLKHNWLSRRAGRNRRGFVATKTTRPSAIGVV